jgi:4-amino-4-deoxy-L-arabinose transferase-like glycosyltransferase
MRANSSPAAPRWLVPVALLLITALAAFLRFWRLDTIPPGFHYDEAYEALEAWRVMIRPDYRPIFFAGNFGVEPMFIYLTAVAFRLFGPSPEVMRAVGATVGTLTIPALYLLAAEFVSNDRRIYPAMPLLAAACLAIMRWHITFSRMGIEPVLVPLFLVIMLWAFWRAMRTGRLWAWAVMGLAAGLSMYTYPGGRLVPVLAALLGIMVIVQVVAAHMRRGRVAKEQAAKPVQIDGRIVGLLLAGGVALIVFAPLALNWVRHPDQLLLRSSQIAVGPGGSAAGTPAGTPLQNFVAALGMFSLRGDADPRSNVPGMPVLDVLMTIPFVIGVFLFAWRWRHPVSISWWLAAAVMLAPTVFSEYAPHFRRALGLAPLVALAAGLGLAVILGRRDSQPVTAPADVPPRLLQSGVPAVEMARDMDRLRAWGRLIVVLVILAASAVYSATVYFGVWGRSHALYYAYDQGLWEIGQYVLGLPADERVYVTPRPASDMTLAFAWREGRPVRHFDGRRAFVMPDGGSGAGTYIVIEHEDFRGANVLKSLYPDAEQVKEFLDRDGTVYARAFRVPEGGQPARGAHNPVRFAWPDAELIGYDLDKDAYRPGDIVYLQLWWRAQAQSATDWTVFTHLLGPAKADGSVLWAGQDAKPGQGSASMTAWEAGDLVLDEYQIQIPADAPPGEYGIEVGLYDLAAGGARSVMTAPAGEDHAVVGALRVE